MLQISCRCNREAFSIQVMIADRGCQGAAEPVGVGAWASDNAQLKTDALLAGEIDGDDCRFGL